MECRGKGVELEGRNGHPSLGRRIFSIGQNTEFINNFSLLLNTAFTVLRLASPGFSDGHSLLLFHFSDMCVAELAMGCYIAVAAIPTTIAGGLHL